MSLCSPRGSRLRAAVVVITLLPLCGCVSRRLTIQSVPSGALVELDGRRIGHTPVSTDFTYYGTREIKLSKPGFETLTVHQAVPTPWYQVPPLDFISDNFLLTHVTDRHDFTYSLQPQRIVPEQELIDRGGQLRIQSQVGQ